MTEKDKIIASLRKQLQDANRKISGLEQEVALLKYQLELNTNTMSFVPPIVPVKKETL